MSECTEIPLHLCQVLEEEYYNLHGELKPQKVKVDVNLLKKPDKWFITQLDKESCAVAGTQIVLALHGKGSLSESFQKEIESRIDEWESRRDSLNGGWGPAAIVNALEAYGVHGYEVRAYDTRGLALRDAAKAISKYHAPVILLSWRGAHTWVMTGFKATADPRKHDDARVTRVRVMDPLYPHGSRWGASPAPNRLITLKTLARQFVKRDRPEYDFGVDPGWLLVLPVG